MAEHIQQSLLVAVDLHGRVHGISALGEIARKDFLHPDWELGDAFCGFDPRVPKALGLYVWRGDIRTPEDEDGVELVETYWQHAWEGAWSPANTQDLHQFEVPMHRPVCVAGTMRSFK